MNKACFKILSLITLLSLFNCAKTPIEKKCDIKRGAFDIGSGSSKVIFAEVDQCLGKINKILFSAQEPIKFKETISKRDYMLAKKTILKAQKTLTKWKKIGDDLGIEHYKGVATEVFRQAINGPKTIKLLNSIIPLTIITQKDEAIFSFWSGVANSDLRPQDLVVWDIGGGSMQISHLQKGKFSFHLSKTASVSFKNHILTKRRLTPNPLTPAGAKIALQKSMRLAEEQIEKSFIQGIAGKKVIGVGGVHYHSLRKQMDLTGEEPYTQELLQKTLNRRSYLTDKQIGGPYAKTEVSNLALVLGHMKALNVASVYPVNANLTHGILLSPINKPLNEKKE